MTISATVLIPVTKPLPSLCFELSLLIVFSLQRSGRSGARDATGENTLRAGGAHGDGEIGRGVAEFSPHLGPGRNRCRGYQPGGSFLTIVIWRSSTSR